MPLTVPSASASSTYRPEESSRPLRSEALQDLLNVHGRLEQSFLEYETRHLDDTLRIRELESTIQRQNQKLELQEEELALQNKKLNLKDAEFEDLRRKYEALKGQNDALRR
jgi:hypothetical protein